MSYLGFCGDKLNTDFDNAALNVGGKFPNTVGALVERYKFGFNVNRDGHKIFFDEHRRRLGKIFACVDRRRAVVDGVYRRLKVILRACGGIVDVFFLCNLGNVKFRVRPLFQIQRLRFRNLGFVVEIAFLPVTFDGDKPPFHCPAAKCSARYVACCGKFFR